MLTQLIIRSKRGERGKPKAHFRSQGGRGLKWAKFAHAILEQPLIGRGNTILLSLPSSDDGVKIGGWDGVRGHSSVRFISLCLLSSLKFD